MPKKRSETWKGIPEPIEKVKSLYQCPACSYTHSHRIVMLSHYRQKHLAHITDETKIAAKKPQMKEKVILEEDRTCCKKPEYRMLSPMVNLERCLINSGYRAVCKNCEELI